MTDTLPELASRNDGSVPGSPPVEDSAPAQVTFVARLIRWSSTLCALVAALSLVAVLAIWAASTCHHMRVRSGSGFARIWAGNVEMEWGMRHGLERSDDRTIYSIGDYCKPDRSWFAQLGFNGPSVTMGRGGRWGEATFPLWILVLAPMAGSIACWLLRRGRALRDVATALVLTALPALLGLWILSVVRVVEVANDDADAVVMLRDGCVELYLGSSPPSGSLSGKARRVFLPEHFHVLISPDPPLVPKPWRQRLGIRNFSRLQSIQYAPIATAPLVQSTLVPAGGFLVPIWCLVLSTAAASALLLRHSLRYIPPGHCRRCGYNLTGNQSGICPECGRTIRRTAAAPQTSPESKESPTPQHSLQSTVNQQGAKT